MEYKVFFDKLDNATKVLIGIGNGFSKDYDDKTMVSFYNKLAKLLSEKDYFVVSLSKERNIKSSDFNIDKVAIPLDDSISIDDNEKKWNDYTGWLSQTLNKDFLVIELGVGFELPTLIRWPFEKIAMLNNKAFLYRVNETFPQLPEDIGENGMSLKISVDEFVETIYAERFGN